MNSVGEVLGKLAATQFDALIGVSEGVWLDAKETPYLVETLKQKLELAKDVSAMANSVGGLIVLGFDTERDVLTAGERISDVKPFPLAMIDSDRYRKVIQEYVYPPLDVEISVYEAEAEKGVAAIGVREGSSKP